MCLTLPILEGTDGVQKMSKSLDNYIGIAEPPEEMYGKTLSIPDELIFRYFLLATDAPTEELDRLKEFAERNPRDAKHELAWTIVRMYHGVDAAKAARQHFEQTVIQGGVPDDMPEVAVAGESIGIVDLIRQADFAASNGEARRLVQQNAVSLDDEKVTDIAHEVDLNAAPLVLKVGKRRFARVIRA